VVAVVDDVDNVDWGCAGVVSNLADSGDDGRLGEALSRAAVCIEASAVGVGVV
jgi:hypothetical protein